MEIDILFSVIGMPDMNGKEAVDRAWSSRPLLPELIMTGYAEKLVFGNGKVEEGVQLLTKPFSIEEIVLRIKAMIDAEDACARRRASRNARPQRRVAGSFRVHCRPEVAEWEPTGTERRRQKGSDAPACHPT
ncbi:response regulator [Caballeronia temeraria]|uniref:response regulator n=1 Tax=Caballeronia temeraria TaxID=1777137 RepID=UPI0007723572|nr:response regulator [Caballeronia temeraria]